MTISGPAKPSHEFSLVAGGPLFQLFLRTRVSGLSLERVPRRILLFTLIAWAPLFLLTLLGAGQPDSAVKVRFPQDIAAHIRFLVVLPSLIAAESIVHRRLRATVSQFVEREIVAGRDIPRFQAQIRAALRARDSVLIEGSLLLLVYVVGGWLWRNNVALGPATWYAIPEAGRLHFTPAGYWYAFVSIPLFQFILLRWYFRLAIWVWFLWRVSRLNLQIDATHTDGAAGLSFLGQGSYAFTPILFAQGTMLAGVIANRVLFGGSKLAEFSVMALGLVIFWLLCILGPLMIFTPHLSRAKWQAELEYGRLVSQFMRAFHGKWIRPDVPKPEEMLGNPDYSSMVDLGSSYAVMRQMRLVPFGMEEVIWLGIATTAPLLPLALTVFSLDELVAGMVHLLI